MLADAAIKGDVEAITLLINMGADVNSSPRYASLGHRLTPVMLAAKHGMLDAVKVLVAIGATLRFQTTEGDTALTLAAEMGQTEVCRWLLQQHYFQPDKQNHLGMSALIIAAKSGKSDLVRLLLTYNVPIDQETISGNTALYWAAYKGYPGVVEMLLEAGAHVNHINNRGASALSVSCAHGYPNITQLLLVTGADITISDNTGRTPLMLGAVAGDEDVVRLLLERCPYLESMDAKNKTAYDLALASDEPEIAYMIQRATIVYPILALSKFSPTQTKNEASNTPNTLQLSHALHP
ncbi:hypothetical protein Pmani_008912 [Petrolisthes manimaculis]|uniref:Uncharacterized protein n=1 Tax=Petrolisthes manimaculis TaxID=1843537 RepID=A0AAE1Q5E9_9EUCA|nr:hypothetical protein Pmani_008912 [Petrolisthes manimaculis]